MPALSPVEMETIAKLVDKVIVERSQVSGMPVSASEKVLNTMIYRLYGLSDADAEVVEKRSMKKGAREKDRCT